MEKVDKECKGCILGKEHIKTFPIGKSIRKKGTLRDSSL